MAWVWRAICNHCETSFDAAWGHTRSGYCFRCGECGRPHFVLKEEVEKPPGTDFGLSQVVEQSESKPKRTLEELSNELLNRSPSRAYLAWQERVEAVLPVCICGGRFRFNAPSRCPQCRSDDHRQDPSGWEMHAG
jgi:hypothetical protein